MSTAFAGMIGEAPSLLVQPVVRGPRDREQEKYEKAWNHAPYRGYSPGENSAFTFINLAKPAPGDLVIDFGTGTGRGALMLALMGSVKVQMLDFAGNCLDEDVRNALTTQKHMLSFEKHDLRDEPKYFAKYGYCTDVMEHIPPEDVDLVLHNVLRSAQHIFFQISTVPDHFGSEIGESLHLTVQPFEWWQEKLKAHDAVIQWSSKTENACAFYVSAWQTVQDMIIHGVLNNEQETIYTNVESAMTLGLAEVAPYEKQDTTVIILAGGPSMNDFKDEIIERRKAGEKLVTVNGAYNWAMNHGIVPSAQVMVDSREFNKRFLEPVHKDVKYLLASQCAPQSFAAVPAEQTMLWHSAIDDETIKRIERFYLGTGKPWYPVLGGSTVMLRTLPLFVLLGYSRFEVYGFDSCLMGGNHHAYTQTENDGQAVLQVVVNNRTFPCHPWMVSQAQEFLDLMQLMSEHIELVVHGDGLISWLIKTASEMDDVKIDVVQ